MLHTMLARKTTHNGSKNQEMATIAWLRYFVRERSLQVTKTIYSGLQEHRSIKYTATGQSTKPKERMSTDTTDTRT
jgi:hypothetical protein